MWGPYQTFKELVAGDPRATAENPMFVNIDHPELGVFPTAGSPIRFGAARAVRPKPAPRLGEHTEEVLREFNLT
jgi:2-methylfumaryl-CoA isomerase